MSLRRYALGAALIFFVTLGCHAQSPVPTGSVTVSYTLSRLTRIASNQYAIWIEDEKGSFVRTLFATNFVAKKAGWKNRPQTVPTWIRAAGVGDLPQKELDAISGATPGSGSYKVDWDLRDSKGQLVASGRYRYLIEGNIYWEKRVVWSGIIAVGNQAQLSQAAPVYSPNESQLSGMLISNVSATYTPGK
jgi:hypothetical protein